MYEITLNGMPVKIWARYVDPHAMKEIVNLSTLPFVFHHLAFMPDVHGGKGMPIGGVLATKGAVIPNAVGVDIGCGMCAETCPEVFTLTDAGVARAVRDEIDGALAEKAKEAAEGCPVSAIGYDA